MFCTVAAAGLRRWAPDVLKASPDSMYNLLHKHLALSTFEQVSNAYGYSHIGHDMSLVKDFPLMRKLYRNFVFSFMRDRAKMEARHPGMVETTANRNPIWRRRSTVSILISLYNLEIELIYFEFKLMQGRVFVAKSHHFRHAVVKLLSEPEVHSDDKLAQPDPPPPADVASTSAAIAVGVSPENNVIYHITDKGADGRAKKVKLVVRVFDDQRKKLRSRTKTRYKYEYTFNFCTHDLHSFSRQERTRVDPPISKRSAITAIPKETAIDYFNPEFWNSELTIREKAVYIRHGVTIALPKEEFCRTWADIVKWKDLSDEEFMEHYGDAVLQEYIIPTAKQIEEYEDHEYDVDEEDEPSDVEDFDDVDVGDDNEIQQQFEEEEEGGSGESNMEE